MEGDISRNTIFVLVILTLLISILFERGRC